MSYVVLGMLFGSSTGAAGCWCAEEAGISLAARELWSSPSFCCCSWPSTSNTDCFTVSLSVGISAIIDAASGCSGCSGRGGCGGRDAARYESISRLRRRRR